MSNSYFRLSKGYSWRMEGSSDASQWTVYKCKTISVVDLWVIWSSMEVTILTHLRHWFNSHEFDRKIWHMGRKSTVCAQRWLASESTAHIVVRFTVRNITINNAQTAVFSAWNWGRWWRLLEPYQLTSGHVQDGPFRVLISTTARFVPTRLGQNGVA
jgi:hypothetical protein